MLSIAMYKLYVYLYSVQQCILHTTVYKKYKLYREVRSVQALYVVYKIEVGSRE